MTLTGEACETGVPRRRVRLPMAAACIGLVLAAVAGAAGPAAPQSTPDGVRIELTPFMWAPAINGQVTLRGFSADVNASFLDIVGIA